MQLVDAAHRVIGAPRRLAGYLSMLILHGIDPLKLDSPCSTVKNQVSSRNINGQDSRGGFCACFRPLSQQHAADRKVNDAESVAGTA